MQSIGGGELADLDTLMPTWVHVLQALALWASAVLFSVWALRAAPDLWITPAERPTPRPNVPPAQAALIKRIEAAMAEGLWREEGLTVSGMARRLDTQDHRLRAAINQGLGHRNFASFINQHRIEAAKTVLADPSRADVPVLSIAHDVGFASLGPFNRAFREITGQSPTQFRQNAQS